MMTAGIENLRTPSMVMPVPAAATNTPTQSGSTFHFVFMLFHNVRIAAGWAIRHKGTEPLVVFIRRSGYAGGAYNLFLVYVDNFLLCHSGRTP